MFSEIFTRELRARTRLISVLSPPGACHTQSSRLCTLCHASRSDYENESEARNAALQQYWRALGLDCPLEPLVRSPLGRGYRTVSKRKAFLVRGDVRLGLIDPAHRAAHRPTDVTLCLIEPAVHGAIYAHLGRALLEPFARPIGPLLRYVVIKGNYRQCIVIFSLTHIDGESFRIATTLSKALTRACPQVRGVMLYQDSSDGRYYLGTRSPASRATVRKVYGQSEVRQRYGGKDFLFPALSFSQVNASLVDSLIEEAHRMFELTSRSTLYDLYCGYGVFTLTLGSSARRAVGIDLAPESIDAAAANAKRQHATGVRFLRTALTGEALASALPALTEQDAVLLDPPRGGTSPGVIECIAARRPGRVVHLFCNIERMPQEIVRWRESGYRPSRSVPFDMFPGTDDTEIMTLLKPASSRGEISVNRGEGDIQNAVLSPVPVIKVPPLVGLDRITLSHHHRAQKGPALSLRRGPACIVR